MTVKSSTTSKSTTAYSEGGKSITIPSATGVPMGSATTAPDPPKPNSKAMASLVCGIVGILIFGVILGPIAICLGLAAKKEIEENPGMEGTCQANAGIGLGVVALIVFFVFLLLSESRVARCTLSFSAAGN